VVGADFCHDVGFEVAPLTTSTIEKIDKLLPPYWSRGNPVDLVGSLDLERHLRCLEVLAGCDEIDIVLALGTITGFPDFREHDEKFLMRSIELVKECKKPIVLVKMFEGYESELLESYGSFIFPSPERAISALWRMYEYKRFLERELIHE